MTANCDKLYAAIGKELREKLDDTRYDLEARREVLLEHIDNIKHERRQLHINTVLRKTRTNWFDEAAAKLGGTARAYGKVLNDFVFGVGGRQGQGDISIEKHIEGIVGHYSRKLHTLFEQEQKGFPGFKKAPETNDKLVAAIYGQSVDDPMISKMAARYLEVVEELRIAHNKAGGNIKKLDNYGLKLSHDPAKIGADKDAWMAMMMDESLFEIRLRDSSKTPYPKGGKVASKPDVKPLTKQEVLEKIWENRANEAYVDPDKALGDIATDGTRQPTMGNYGRQWRTIQPVSGEAWLGYTKKFGIYKEPLEAIDASIQDMSRRIGLMDRLGTNPSEMMEDIIKAVRLKTQDNIVGTQALHSLDQIRSRTTVSNTTVGKVTGDIRNYHTATKLVATPVTAIPTDTMFTLFEAAWNGVPVFKMFGRLLKQLNPLDNTDRLWANYNGLTMDVSMNHALNAYRFADLSGSGLSSQMAIASTSVSGLNPWTNGAKVANLIENMNNIAQHLQHTLPELKAKNPNLHRMMERYGFTDEQWLDLRKALVKHKGMVTLDLNKLETDLSIKMIGTLKSIQAMAVPESHAGSRAAVSGWQKPGTIPSDIAKLLTQFKIFPTTIMFNQGARALDSSVSGWHRGMYMGSLVGTGALVGYGINAMNDVVNGKTPREFTPKALLEGIVRSGTLGLVMDVVGTDPNLFGGLPGQIGGPTVSDMNRLAGIIWGAAKDFEPAAAEWWGELAAKGLTEVEKTIFITNLSYTRQFFKHTVYDHLRSGIDPNFNKKTRRKEKRMKEEYNNQYYWRPGDVLPELP